MITVPDLQELPNREMMPPTGIQVPFEQVEDVSIIDPVPRWRVSNTTSAGSTEPPQRVFKVQFRSVLNTASAEVRMLATLVCGTRTVPTSDTSPSVEWTTLLTSDVFEEAASDSAPAELMMRRISELRAKWGFGTAYAEPPEAQEAPDAHEADVDVGAAEQALPEPGADREPETTSWAIAELRRFSGLTWEQIAELFGVSRRSVHAWAGGSPLNARNEKHLRNTLDIIRHTDRGLTKYNRAALLEKKGGVAPFDLLSEQKFDEAREALGPGIEWDYPPLPELSPEARAARLPLRPEVLMDAKTDRIHEESGRGRGVRTVRNQRRGHS